MGSFSAKRIQAAAKDARFRPEVYEKAARLLEYLAAVDEHPHLRPRLTLRGGTSPCDADGRFEFDSASQEALYCITADLPVDDVFMNYSRIQTWQENVPAGSLNVEFTFKRQ